MDDHRGLNSQPHIRPSESCRWYFGAIAWEKGRLARGRKRAIVAVGHSLLVIGYHLQKNRCIYQDLGADYFDRINAEGLKRYLVKRLEALGQKVTLEPRNHVA